MCLTVKTIRANKKERGINFGAIPNKFKREYLKYVFKGYPLSTIKSKKLTDLTVNAINDKPNNTDTLVTYTDRWMWDITMYMIAIDMQFFDVDKGVPIGDAHNMRSSLLRKTPRGMIRGALYEFFDLDNPDDVAPEAAPAYN